MASLSGEVAGTGSPLWGGLDATRGALADLSNAPRRLAFLVGLLALYGAAIAWMGGLRFPLYVDERQFWQDTLLFAASWPPGIDTLRSYPEPMTPLAFVLWGAIESAFHGGIAAVRSFNLVLSFGLVALVGLGRRRPRTALLSALGLLCFPYVIPLGIHLYTDVTAVLFAVLGICLYARGSHRSSAVAFALAIATRQYMVIFPAAFFAFELLVALRDGRGDAIRRGLPLALAAATLLGWFAFFGGVGPAAGMQAWPRHLDGFERINGYAGLYLLTCVGAYFVIPECLLFRRWAGVSTGDRTRLALIALGLLCAFLVSPPPALADRPGGPLGRLLLMTGTESLRPVLFYGLALAACLRFARIDRGSLVVLASFALMLTTHTAWEKYYLPTIAALWALQSRGLLERDRCLALAELLPRGLVAPRPFDRALGVG